MQNDLFTLWGGTSDTAHYQQHTWPKENPEKILIEIQVENPNVKWKPIIEPKDVLVRPLHIKLNFMKQFVKAHNQILSFTICEKCFVGQRIKKIKASDEFTQLINTPEKTSLKHC